MSRQFDAKQHVLAIYPNKCSDGLTLFLDYCNIGEGDFEYEEGMTAEKYIWGEQPKDNNAKL